LAVVLAIGVIATPSAQAQTLKTLWSFNGASDGSSPVAGLIMSNGILYGTTQLGGAHQQGVVFELSATGKKGTEKETVLYSFKGGKDGVHSHMRVWSLTVRATSTEQLSRAAVVAA